VKKGGQTSTLIPSRTTSFEGGVVSSPVVGFAASLFRGGIVYGFRNCYCNEVEKRGGGAFTSRG